jgi:predicted permease
MDRELEEELRFHLESRVESLRACGLSGEDARQQALCEFGNLTLVTERGREMFGFPWWDGVWRDVRYGARSLLRTPALVIVASVSLALGVSVNLVVYALLQAFFLNDITAKESGRLAKVRHPFSYPNYTDISEAGIFAETAAYAGTEIHCRTGSESRQVFAQIVTSNFFEVLGVEAWMGRAFRESDKTSDLVVASYSFWERVLDADPGVIGRAAVLNGRPFTIVGVLPKGYRSVIGHGVSPRLWVVASPFFRPNLYERGNASFSLLGRLREGWTRDQTATALNSMNTRLEKMYPEDNVNLGRPRAVVGMSTWQEFEMDGEARTVALFSGLLAVVAGLVLLIACANVAGLLLARGAVRSRELAIRLAIGASRTRLLRQLTIENLMLAVAGVALGYILHRALTMVLERIELPIHAPLEFDFSPERSMLWLALALVVMVTVAAGLLPALSGVRGAGSEMMRRGEGSPGHGRVRSLLVAGQVAASVLLLVTAVLFLRSLSQLMATDPGFEVDRTLMVRATGPNLRQRRLEMRERMAALPGVEAVSCASIMPLQFEYWSPRLRREDRPEREVFQANAQPVCADYLNTMRIRLLRGRDLNDADFREGAPRVTVISDSLARRYFPDEDPIGKRVLMLHTNRREMPAYEVVGISADAKFEFLGERARPVFYFPEWSMRFVVRTAGPPERVVPVIREAAGALDPLGAVEFRTMTAHVAASWWPTSFAATLLGLMGGMGLALAMVGLFGALSFSVARRTREIGIRMAVGATQGEIVRTFVESGLRIVGAGGLAGLLAAAALTRLLSAFLAEGVATLDPLSYAVVVLLLSMVATIAVARPALRASRVDPAESLRHD